MEFFPSIKLNRQRRVVATDARAICLSEDKLIALSSWMMVLGTIRLLCVFADYASAFANALRFEPMSLRMLSRFFEENQPVVAISAAWPLLIAILVRRNRWPDCYSGRRRHILILALGGLLEVVAEWNQSRGDGITVASFHLTRRALLKPTLADVTLGLLGASQLIAEMATAFRSLQLAHAFRGVRAQQSDSDKHETARRARIGRLAIYASLGFLVLMVRLPVWSTYLEIVNESTLVREFVLKNDIKRMNGPPRVRALNPNEREMLNLHVMLGAGYNATASARYLDAKESYLRIIARANASSEKPLLPGSVSVVAEAENNLAWMLATCPTIELRDPPQAVLHARRAVALVSSQGNFWNTLGVALYRNEQWVEAQEALQRSMDLRNQGDSFDWFFLALVYLKQGQQAEGPRVFRQGGQLVSAISAYRSRASALSS